MSEPKKVVEVVRLSPQQYEALEKSLPGPLAQPNAAEHYVGMLLGIQFVLQKLRQGFTVG